MLVLLLGYGQTKWVAEKIVGLARKDFGLPVIVARTGMIGGHSLTGACAKDDLIALLLQSMVVSGCRPHGFFKITLTPVDFVSSALMNVAFDRGCYGRMFHMIHKQLVSLRDMGDVLESCGYDLRCVRYGDWVDRLRENRDSAIPWQLVAALNPYADHWDTYLSREGQGDVFLRQKEKDLWRTSKMMLSVTVSDLLRQKKFSPPPGLPGGCD